MATDLQYRAFKDVYEEENERYTDLENLGKTYLTLGSAYIGFVVFKPELAMEAIKHGTLFLLLYLVIASCLLLSVLFTVIALGVYTYEGLFDPEEVYKELAEKKTPDEDFLDDRLADLAVATRRNMKVNDRKANWLQLGSWSLWIGVGLHVVVFLLLSTRPT